MWGKGETALMFMITVPFWRFFNQVAEGLSVKDESAVEASV
jgi:hypothetical protein